MYGSLPERDDALREKSGPDRNAQDVMDEDFESFLDWRLSGEVYHQGVGAAYMIAIETSSSRGSVALARGREVIRSLEFEASRRPSELLMEPLGEILDLVGKGSIALVVVGTGPGSYNGARVGIAAGQGVGIVHRCPTIGICSLEGLPTVRTGERCVALSDARRGTFSTIDLNRGRVSAAPVLSEHLQFEERARVAAEHGQILVTLDEVSRLGLSEYQIRPELPSAAFLLESWLGRTDEEQEELASIPPQPFYLRPPHITKPKENLGVE